MCKMRRFRSPGPLLSIHTFWTDYSVSRQWRPWSDCANAQSDQGLCCPHIPEDMFIHDVTQIKIHKQILMAQTNILLSTSLTIPNLNVRKPRLLWGLEVCVRHSDIPEDLQDSSGYSRFLCQVFMQLHNQRNAVLQIRLFGRTNLTTLKTFSEFAADDFLNFVLLFFREYKTCHLMWLVCWADDSH